MIVALAGTAGCYQAHERPGPGSDAGDVADAYSARDSGEAGRPDAPSESDAWHSADTAIAADACPGLRPVMWDGPCTLEHEAECERLAAIGAGHRFAHARCMASEGQSFCESGDICGATTCLCTPTRACTPVTEVCVSDTPDGPRTCARACSDAR